jgi:hypothetical protein
VRLRISFASSAFDSAFTSAAASLVGCCWFCAIDEEGDEERVVVVEVEILLAVAVVAEVLVLV